MKTGHMLGIDADAVFVMLNESENEKQESAMDEEPLGEGMTPEQEKCSEIMGDFMENLEHFESGHLEMLIEYAQGALANAKAREERQALAEMEEVAKRHGFRIEDLLQRRAEKIVSEQGTSEPVRFRHPKDSSLTWTGRGRLPAWLKEMKEAGEDIERFRVRA